MRGQGFACGDSCEAGGEVKRVPVCLLEYIPNYVGA